MSHNIVGLTGGIGCGKTTVTDLLANKGIPIVDADIVAREVVAPQSEALQKISQRFGESILLQDGSLNRVLLRDIIFKDKIQKVWLEALLHPIIRSEICQQLELASKQHPYVILSSPLLLETDQSTLASVIVIIDIDKESQIQRATQRDNNTIEQIERIIDNQLDRDSRITKADYVIDNCGELEQLYSNVDNLHKTLTAKFSA